MAEQESILVGSIQTEQLDGLIEAAGCEGAREILNAFWRSTSDLLGALETQIAQTDFNAAAQTAHAIKGSAANVGAVGIAEKAYQIELASKASNKDGADACLVQLKAESDQAQAQFENYLTEKSD